MKVIVFPMKSAWMIRNDGKAILVIQHIYANPSEAEETLTTAEWLYQNTRKANTKKLVLETMAFWGREIQGGNSNNFILTILKMKKRWIYIV